MSFPVKTAMFSSCFCGGWKGLLIKNDLSSFSWTLLTANPIRRCRNIHVFQMIGEVFFSVPTSVCWLVS